MIPIDPIGYKVDDRTIHTRYANHGDGPRTRTAKGVETLLGGKRPVTCLNCYPSPKYPERAKPQTPQKRRTPK